MTVEAMEVDAPEVQTPVEPLPPFGTVSILHIIKDAQQKHGLRHKDYDRYMGYCGRRIERVRTSLKFKHTLKGKRKNAKFTLRPVTVESITEERFFDVVLFEAERCWAYAMALKQEAENDAESRKKFHKIRKLRKAVKHATQLEALAKQCDRADAATKLESQAYTAWIKGSLAFESHKWSEAYNFFNTVITIYERLAGLTKVPEMVELFKTKCEEVRPQMKYCKFNCGETEVAMSEIMNMKLDASELDTLISQVQAKVQSEGGHDIRWGGQTIPVGSNKKAQQALVAFNAFKEQIGSLPDDEHKMTIYEKLLSQLREAVQSLKDEARKAGTSTSLETAIAFFDFARLTKTAERYIFMVNAIQADESRKSKPQDFIRLLDSIVATYEEAAGVQGSDSVEGFADVMDFKAEYYKSLKAYYNAEMYTTNSKFAESDLLYGRALERAEKAENMLKNVAGNPLISETQKDIAETKAKISSSKIEAEENRDKEAAEPAQKPIFFDLALNYVKMPKKEKQEEVEEMEDNKEQPAVLPAPKPAAPSKPAPKKKTAPKSAATEPQAQGISDKFKGWFWGS